ncbi:MAG TPA: YiiX family permuted papain-like enzyme [Bacteroidota bacterium]|nr:YiiX family permuted papain-like enzyme [Bacteroidota bacterium]
MRTLLRLIPFIVCACTLCRAGDIPLREGDIVFQTIPSSQSRAIQAATKSRFSHVGMVLVHEGRLMVYEAIGPVKFTAPDAWLGRDTNHHVVVKRLRNADSLLTKANLAKLESAAQEFEGKPYDSAFNWSDEKLYCSELVWKVFDRALGIDIGVLRKLKSFDLSSPEVQKKLKERYPDGVPLEETVVSPQDVFESGLLVTVYEQ